MIYKKCYKCMKKYEYGKQCPCSNREYKKSKIIKGQEDGFYASKGWRNLRWLKMQEYGAFCQRCLILNNEIVTKNLEGHHIKPRSKFPELALDPDNVVIICQLCNKKLSNSGIVDWDRSKEIKQDMNPYL